MQKVLTQTLFTLVLLTSCGQPGPPPEKEHSAVPPERAVTSQEEEGSASWAHAPATRIPADIEYTVIEEETVPGIKRSLDVRLSKKVSEEVLESIAMELKRAARGDYRRTFIDYYLPGMTVGAVAWATTHFNPDLEVRVLGLTIEDETALAQEREDPSREVVGAWLDERPFMGRRISIFRQDGELLMEVVYKDGSSSLEPLVEKRSPLGRRFEEVEKSSTGDHWILDSAGDLQLRDDEGLISTAQKID